jgi:broad specificity phosphatase PhoE
MNPIESSFKNEAEKKPKIILHFFRHSIKESDNPYAENDASVRLSKEGQDLAITKSSKGTDLSQSLAFGSPRVRTQETAALVMAGENISKDSTNSLGDIASELNASGNLGSKVGIDERLNFRESTDTPLGKLLSEASARGEYVKFIVEQSDKLAEELDDQSGANYSAKAAQVAQIIDKYLTVSKRWNQLVHDESKNYNEKLERFLSTHAGIGESFIAKVLEETKGIDERNKFVDAIGGNYVSYVEGFNVEIVPSSDSVLISSTIPSFVAEIRVPVDTIKKIAQK